MGEKNLPDKVDEIITEVLNKDPVVLASISTVPIFGSTLATFFSAKWLQVYQERTKSLFDKFGEDINELDERTLRKDFFETDEGMDLLMKATEQSARTRSEEKRDLIARILAGAASTDTGQSEYSPEEYLSIVASLTPRELEVARTIYDLQKDISPRELESDNRMETWRLCVESMREKHAIDKDELPLLLNRIASTGLVDLIYVQYPGSPAPTY